MIMNRIKLYNELEKRTYYDTTEMVERIMELEHIDSFSEAQKIAMAYTRWWHKKYPHGK